MSDGDRTALRGINLNLLVVLEAILTERNVTRAGTRVGLTQSAVSAALEQLRVVFDDPLLVPNGNRLELSARARELEGPVREALDDLERVFRFESAPDPETFEGEATICATDYGTVVVGGALVASLSRVAPGLRLRLVRSASDDAAASLDREADLAIGVLALPSPEHRRIVLFEERPVCLVRRGHPLAESAHEGRVDGALLMATPQVHAAVYPERSTLTEQLLRDAGLHATPRVITDSFAAAALIAARSDLATFVGSRLARMLANHADLVALELPSVVPAVPIAMIWHRRVDRHPLQSWLRDRIVEATALDDAS